MAVPERPATAPIERAECPDHGHGHLQPNDCPDYRCLVCGQRGVIARYVRLSDVVEFLAQRPGLAAARVEVQFGSTYGRHLREPSKDLDA